MQGTTADKIRGFAAAVAWRQSIAGRVVFTNGVFDLLHVGHVALLEESRRRGDALIVGVNSDVSVRSLGKGTDRPLVPGTDRARLLAALQCVDAVVLFDEQTPLELIMAIRPDLLVKGADYQLDQVVGAAEVRARGGEVALVPLVPDRSTTRLLERLRASS
ncbi:MAG TPA: D-glycero-beta-D-manno-heptose 1-phosphate adenylyltransferase [Gemmatimonadales bacterium]